MLQAAKELGITNKEYRARQLAEGIERYNADGAKPMKRMARANRLIQARLEEKEAR